ncbi:MAG: 2-amino-3,7-dideoxy-D-threo-hept-6-ulosonate synthase [Thermoplasmata archaeon]|nr:2-amino-3,7-dideoxy-D-threo-hept-6-ulosonate synthase [Thermoplasmata archaeon]
MNGKALRMRRIVDVKTGKTVIVPMDHGVSLGPVKGIGTINDTIKKVGTGGASCVVVHKGIAKQLTPDLMANMGLVLHLSASTSLWNEPNRKTIIGNVDDAVKLGADAVSIHVNLGGKYESEMLEQMGEISSQCIEMGMPLLAMMYPRGENIKSQFDVEAVKNCARVGAELGADIVKTNYTGDVDSFREVIKGCHVPVVIAGGPKMDSEDELTKMVKEAMQAGAKGVSIGRNVFQHNDITYITKKLADIVFSY